MPNEKGITLVEIIVTMIIIGVLAAIAIPNYNFMINKGIAQSAANNLTTMTQAQQSYYYKNGNYCLGNTPAKPSCTATSANCADTLAAINCNLGLNIIDTNNGYECIPGWDGAPIQPNPNDPECVAYRFVPTLEELYTFKKNNGLVQCDYASDCGTPCLTSPQYCPN